MNDLIKTTRVLMGIIFLWYGALKLFPSVSPAEELATATIDILFFSVIPPHISIKLLGIWEIIIGLGFLSGKFIKEITVFFLLHMVLTFTPLILLPEISFTNPPFSFTLVGQYIVKNLIFIMVGLLILRNELKTL